MDAADPSPATWRKSSYSNVDGCVEIAFLADRVAIRDSKARQGPTLLFNAVEWKSFLNGVRNGEFDLPDCT